ncbi:hypothetical protein [Micromonospora sp. NPDC049282]|uniref:hypothetical protein n=1 Tax=Micromonospora sp. NPDC049282 TaxID=3364269 RepID=UPI00371467DE
MTATVAGRRAVRPAPPAAPAWSADVAGILAALSPLVVTALWSTTAGRGSRCRGHHRAHLLVDAAARSRATPGWPGDRARVTVSSA